MYRIYVEDVPEFDSTLMLPKPKAGPRWDIERYSPIARALAAHGLPGATVLRGIGFWKGQQERSLVIEIDNPGWIERQFQVAVYLVARDLKRDLRQEAVLVQHVATTSEMI